MYLYLAVFLVLGGLAAYEFIKGKTQKSLYWIAFGILTAMLCLRYGQGVDYFGYQVNYANTPTLTHVDELVNTTIHGEPGWLLLSSLLRTFSIPFEALVVMIAIVEMLCLHRFVSRHSPLKTVSLMLAFPTFYLTYAMSALRQGLVIFLFIGFLFDWFCERKYIRYIICVCACATIHSSALILLAPFVAKKFAVNTKLTILYIILCFAGGYAVSWILPHISSAFAFYAGSGISIVALGERLASTALILFVFHKELDAPREQQDAVLTQLLRFYLYGTFAYCFLFWNALISSRFAALFKVLEIALFAIAMSRKDKKRYLTAAFCFALYVVMYFKNIDSYILQGNYYNTVNILNYPYNALWNAEGIHRYRPHPYRQDTAQGLAKRFFVPSRKQEVVFDIQTNVLNTNIKEAWKFHSIPYTLK